MILGCKDGQNSARINTCINFMINIFIFHFENKHAWSNISLKIFTKISLCLITLFHSFVNLYWTFCFYIQTFFERKRKSIVQNTCKDVAVFLEQLAGICYIYIMYIFILYLLIFIYSCLLYIYIIYIYISIYNIYTYIYTYFRSLLVGGWLVGWLVGRLVVDAKGWWSVAWWLVLGWCLVGL